MKITSKSCTMVYIPWFSWRGRGAMRALIIILLTLSLGSGPLRTQADPQSKSSREHFLTEQVKILSNSTAPANNVSQPFSVTRIMLIQICRLFRTGSRPGHPPPRFTLLALVCFSPRRPSLPFRFGPDLHLSDGAPSSRSLAKWYLPLSLIMARISLSVTLGLWFVYFCGFYIL